jgi:hypothetical protein
MPSGVGNSLPIISQSTRGGYSASAFEDVAGDACRVQVDPSLTAQLKGHHFSIFVGKFGKCWTWEIRWKKVNMADDRQAKWTRRISIFRRFKIGIYR